MLFRSPTDERVRRYAAAPDPSLPALLCQYGRYLLIACSRAGGQPATLQGLWNDSLTPPWDSKYTVNINTEMNYWLAEPGNLSECHAPLFDALEEVAQSGARVAQAHYAAPGWVLHHNFDLWRGAAPINASDHGIWPTGGAWLCQHFWRHWQYNYGTAFLRDRARYRRRVSGLPAKYLCAIPAREIAAASVYRGEDGWWTGRDFDRELRRYVAETFGHGRPRARAPRD